MIVTWGQRAPNAARHRVAQGGLRPGGKDAQQQPGDPVEALPAGEVLAHGAGNHGDGGGCIFRRRSTKHPPKSSEGPQLQQGDKLDNSLVI